MYSAINRSNEKEQRPDKYSPRSQEALDIYSSNAHLEVIHEPVELLAVLHLRPDYCLQEARRQDRPRVDHRVVRLPCKYTQHKDPSK